MSFASSPLPATEPPRDCPLCPRLVAFREALRVEYPGWWNAPVPAFGDPAAWLAIVGLAPGKHGANRTGRPFTGDFAGVLLYETLAKFGLSEGTFDARPDDGLRAARRDADQRGPVPAAREQADARRRSAPAARSWRRRSPRSRTRASSWRWVRSRTSRS